MEPLKIFDDFHLEKLSEAWVKATWDNEFLVIEPIPDDYILFVESNVKDIESLVRDSTKVIKSWIQDNRNEQDAQEAELSWQTLSSLEIDSKGLLALLGYFIKTGQDRSHDEEARESCLLATSLYLTLLTIPGSSVYEIFHENLFQKALDSLKFSELISPSDKKSKQSQDIEHLYEEEDEGLSHSQKKILKEALNTIMYDMILFLKKFSLLDLPRSLEAVVTALIDVTKLGTDNNTLSSPKKPQASLTSLNHNAYAALTDTCDPRHGPVDITIKLIIKNILTFMTNNCYNSLGTKRLANVRETTIHFLKTLINLHKSPAENAILILINLMMMNCSKIAEDRKKEVMMIIKLIKICEGKKIKEEIIKDLLTFSHNNKITSRIFAQEIINKYLMDVFESCESKNHRKILLATVLCRCYDNSSLVRAKALSTIFEYTKIPQNLFVNELFTKEGENEIPLIEDLENAVQNMSQELDILPDANSMISMLKDRVEDERALVRISAIQILRNSVAVNPEFLETTVALIGERCRDPTMTVRTHAIQLLTSLFESFPHHLGFCTIWVKSVVPQIFDVEVKVQVETLKALESLIIKRISRHELNDDLPWEIIKELTKNKMKKHLVKACDAWNQNDILSNSLINNIKSQIESKHKSAAWMLLSAISETRVLSNMQDHLTNYREFLESDDFVEPIFEVLRTSLSKFDKYFLEKLHEDFLKYLGVFKVNSRLINISLDIVHQIHDFLNSRQNYLERTFEKEMELLIEASEAIIEKTMLEKVDEKICERAIYTSGSASLLCTREISLPVLRILQGFLIDQEMIPKWLKSPRKIQASTIIALGQHSMRKESIAQEMMTIFAQLLSSKSSKDAEEDAAVRVNAAKALADVCTRFTSLVEPHLPDICVSMKDSNPAVRQAIVVIFIQLLVEDYIKVKGNFFFHILTMLADKDETIRDMTVFLIKERLLMKNKDIIAQQFFEGILHYNDFELPNNFSKRQMRKSEKETLLLPGKKNEKKRRMIYDFMLENLEPPGTLKLISTITIQIFNGIISGNIKIKDQGAFWVLKDALYIVSSEHLQLGSGGGRQEDDGEETGGNVNSSTNVILEKLKKTVMAVLLRSMIELRRKLKKSEIEADVGRSFVKITGEFSKEQLQGLFSEYPEIEEEFEHNVRLYGKRGEFEGEEEDSSEPIGESTAAKTSNHLLLGNRTPRIVLKRLSSLSYPGVNNSTKASGSEGRIEKAVSTPVVVLNDCMGHLNLINTPESSRSSGSESKNKFK